MKTSELLQELMHKSGHKGSSLATALKDEGVTQSTLSRFLTGKTVEPKRSNLMPVATYYGISVEAFFDEVLAEQYLAKIASGEFVVQRRASARRSSAPLPMPTVAPPASSISPTQAVDAIAASLVQMTDAQREAMAGKLASLARAPDSPTLKKSISESLGSPVLKPPDS